MNFRMLVEDKGKTIQLGKSLDFQNARQERIDAKAEAFNWFFGFLNDTAMEKRVAVEVEKLKPQIKAKLDRHIGVLLELVYTQNVTFGYKNFENIGIVAWGYDFRMVLKQYTDRPKMIMATNSSFTVKTSYFWVTEV